MDENEYPPEKDQRRQFSLERHLTVGRHEYQMTAAGTDDERIGLTLVGWNESGEVVSEISGGISPADLEPVADALTATLAGLATLRRRRMTAMSPRAVPTPAKRHSNQGVRWTPEDDDRLTARFAAGAGRKELMEEFGRSRGGIGARLEHLGLIAPDEHSIRAGRPMGAGPPAGPAGTGEEVEPAAA